MLRVSGYDPDGHNCYLSAVEVSRLSQLDLAQARMFMSSPLRNNSMLQDDLWNVYESYLAAYCPNNLDLDNNGPRPGNEGI